MCMCFACIDMCEVSAEVQKQANVRSPETIITILCHCMGAGNQTWGLSNIIQLCSPHISLSCLRLSQNIGFLALVSGILHKFLYQDKIVVSFVCLIFVVLVLMYMCTHWSQKKVSGAYKTCIPGICEMPDGMLGIKLRSSARACPINE